MAEAIVRGVIRGGLFRPGQIVAADVSPERRALFENELHVRAVDNNADAACDANALLLSVKPQQAADALDGIGRVLSPSAAVISIMAGIGTASIERHLGGGKPWRVVRSMPNTPMLVGEGIVALAPGRHATAQDVAAARRIFESAADVVEVAEEQMDAVTAVSGSGPAYVFYLVEHMIRAGVELGLSDEHARLLASKTALGAAKMLMTSAESPQELRRKVTSLGGTTQAAVTHLEQRECGRAIVEAVKAAERRGKELAK